MGVLGAALAVSAVASSNKLVDDQQLQCDSWMGCVVLISISTVRKIISFDFVIIVKLGVLLKAYFCFFQY